MPKNENTLRQHSARTVVKTVEDVYEFVNTGFEHVTGEYNDGGKIFRKRK